ncbi:hypothetical protein BGW36DRAFT_368687 [Talaromyces proteolyticus]|uniref:Uncharacterized protein n=1 Tax=Talaromyces proteolyticus TaxID=1131652 RepID=A0AAD4L2K9_9EURO|nr:uncharacterized protein BGW36DRAFT_368687 [Talaromyces proteolyticus]KAH8706064.1 hypothetical protein BGW36DRAFT_368687 [Talaromyces proteolyticus]
MAGPFVNSYLFRSNILFEFIDYTIVSALWFWISGRARRRKELLWQLYGFLVLCCIILVATVSSFLLEVAWPFLFEACTIITIIWSCRHWRRLPKTHGGPKT